MGWATMSVEALNWIKQFDSVYIDRLVNNDWQVEIMSDCMSYKTTGISLEDCIECAALDALEKPSENGTIKTPKGRETKGR